MQREARPKSGMDDPKDTHHTANLQVRNGRGTECHGRARGLPPPATTLRATRACTMGPLDGLSWGHGEHFARDLQLVCVRRVEAYGAISDMTIPEVRQAKPPLKPPSSEDSCNGVYQPLRRNVPKCAEI